jgi:1-acyl-sn-glycerol-3-phosphate acyltransferase
MYELMELSGQEYTDMYAATMKERLAAARRAVRPPSRPASRPPQDPDPRPAPAEPPAGI